MLDHPEISLDKGPRIIVALDMDDANQCMKLVAELDPQMCRLKIGKGLFTSLGPSIIEVLQNKGFEVFLDLKFHDIPITVAKAVAAAANLGVWMLNVHASGGKSMLDAAAEALANVEQRPLLIGVTVLTSLDSDELCSIGVNASPQEQVNRLAALAQQSGLDGVVCSAQEAPSLKQSFGERFLTVTPGIRPNSNLSEDDDQKRILTPEQAIANGSDYLVIGRPITGAENPAQVCEQLQCAVEQARP